MKNGPSILAICCAAALAGAGSAAAADAAGGKKLFDAKCASCHGKDGKGNAAMAKMFKVDGAALDLAGMPAEADAEFAKVAGAGKGRMPAFKGKLKASEIEDIRAYVKSLSGEKGK